MLETTSTSASRPAAGVPTELPRPSIGSGCRTGVTSSRLSRPRTHFGTMTGSLCTLSRPSFFISATAQSIARLERLGPREPRAERVGDLGEPLPGEIGALRFCDQPLGGWPVRINPVRARLGAGNGGKGGDEKKDETCAGFHEPMLAQIAHWISVRPLALDFARMRLATILLSTLIALTIGLATPAPALARQSSIPSSTEGVEASSLMRFSPTLFAIETDTDNDDPSPRPPLKFGVSVPAEALFQAPKPPKLGGQPDGVMATRRRCRARSCTRCSSRSTST